jgi:hypothetical protein
MNTLRRRSLLFLLPLIGLILSHLPGCSTPQPAQPAAAVEPSANAAPTDAAPAADQAAPATVPLRLERHWPLAVARYAPNRVRSDPPAMQDEFETGGSDDAKFATTLLDYAIAGAYCPGRFLANLAALPINGVLQFPLRQFQNSGKMAATIEQFVGDDQSVQPYGPPPHEYPTRD